MKKDIINILLIIAIGFFIFNQYNSILKLSDLSNENKVFKDSIIELNKSLYNSFKISHETTLKNLEELKNKKSTIVNNYYENEKEYLHVNTINDTIIEYLTNYRFFKFEPTE